MSYTKYKIILLMYLILLSAPPIFIKYSSTRFEDMSLESMYILYLITVVTWLSLFVFIIYAKSKTIENCSKRITPVKILPAVTMFLIMHFIFYLLASYMSFNIFNEFIIKAEARSERALSKTYKLTVDETNSPEKRINLAAIHYTQTGESIHYLHTNGERLLYKPDKLTENKRVEFIATTKRVDSLNNYIIHTTIVSSLIVIVVLTSFMYIRRTDKHKAINT